METNVSNVHNNGRPRRNFDFVQKLPKVCSFCGSNNMTDTLECQDCGTTIACNTDIFVHWRSPSSAKEQHRNYKDVL